MFGIFLAALCAIGLYRLWRPRRFGHHYAYGCAGGGHGWRRGPRGLRHLMREIEATPAQETALRQGAEEIVRTLRRQYPQAFLEPVTAALTAEQFDRERFAAALREAGDDPFRTAAVAAIERLRETLDAGQRQKLAALMTRRFKP